ncbi:metalloprotease, partial [Klebsiella pneumoniae]|nr:metalloprotease [Klebsiella pneumoniae]
TFPNYDAQREYIRNKNPITESERIKTLKNVAEFHKSLYIKGLKEQEIATIENKDCDEAKKRIDNLKEEIKKIDNININIVNNIPLYFY